MGDSGAELVPTTPPSSPGGHIVRSQRPSTTRGPIKLAEIIKARRAKFFRHDTTAVVIRTNEDLDEPNERTVLKNINRKGKCKNKGFCDDFSVSTSSNINASHSGVHQSPRHSRKRANTFSVSDCDSLSGSLKCRFNHKQLSRNSSNQSAQSGVTVQTMLSSSASQKDGRSYDKVSSRYEDLGDDNVIDGLQLIAEREMNSFQKHIPGLKRHDAKTSTIRQHYYPEGGWGWVICACVFVIHVLTTGMQFSFGVLYTDLVVYVEGSKKVDVSWVGSTSLAVSRAAAPFVVALCRRKSTRLTAVIGGLVMALAVLFASFAHHLHQIFLSWSLVLGVGVGMTRETANLMLGQYFKRRREFVEIIVQSGCGIGITLFSVFFKEAIRAVKWRLGLQAVTGVIFAAFFLGIFYRSASLYHPQRRAILHLKNQKKKQVKDKHKVDSDKPPYFDLSCLKVRSVQVLVLTSAVTATGLYTPLFYLILGAQEEGLEDSSLILLQTFLGFAYALGCIGFGLIVVKQSTQCMISRQYLCQASLYGLGVSILSLTAVRGYYGYVLFMWMYGLLLGGAHYSFQMLTLEKVRARHFSRAWGFIQGATAVPILIGVPITGYINESHAKTGYFLASFLTLIGSSCLFLLNYFRSQINNKHDTSVTFTTVDANMPPEPSFTRPLENGGGETAAIATTSASGSGVLREPQGPVCTCGADPSMAPKNLASNVSGNHAGGIQGTSGCKKLGKNISFATSVDVVEPQVRPELLTCISEERLLNNYYDYVGECVTSCNKFDNFFTFGEFDNIEQAEGEEENGHARSVAAATKRESMSCPMKRASIITPAGHRLRQSSGVSFSEPDDLARLGQNQHIVLRHPCQESAGMCISRHCPSIHTAPLHHHHHHHPHHSSVPESTGVHSLPRHHPASCGSLKRTPGHHRPRRSATVVEEMTTSV